MTDKDYELWEQDINFIRMLREQNEQLEQENQKYKGIIDKATKYIKSYKTDYSPYELSDYNVRQILEILKGDSNE